MASSSGDSEYTLYYWPGLPGRGEFVRLMFAAAGKGALLHDISREEDAVPRVLEKKAGGLFFAPPILVHRRGADDVLELSQTPLIGQYLAPRFGLISEKEQEQWATHVVALTISDYVMEAHDTHHPISVSLWTYEQAKEARRASAIFCRQRMPQILAYLERVLSLNKEGDSKWLVGSSMSYADLFFWQLMEGLAFMFPHNFAKALASQPLCSALHDRVSALEGVQDFVKTKRTPWTDKGIFRYLKEHDPETGDEDSTESSDDSSDKEKKKILKKLQEEEEQNDNHAEEEKDAE